MKVLYSTQFAKDARKLPLQIKVALKELVISIENAQSISGIRDCKPLLGVENGYRIRRGDYRVTISLMIQDDSVMMLRVLSRGQVYKKHIR